MQLLHKFHNTASKSTEYFSTAASQEQGAESKDMLVKLTSDAKLTVGVNVRINACLLLCVSPVLVCVRCTTISHWTGKWFAFSVFTRSFWWWKMSFNVHVKSAAFLLMYKCIKINNIPHSSYLSNPVHKKNKKKHTHILNTVSEKSWAKGHWLHLFTVLQFC